MPSLIENYIILILLAAIILGSQWRNETDEVKARYADMANEIRDQFHMRHPQYQYQPRRPCERKRRIPRRVRPGLNDETAPRPTENAGSNNMTEVNDPAQNISVPNDPNPIQPAIENVVAIGNTNVSQAATPPHAPDAVEAPIIEENVPEVAEPGPVEAPKWRNNGYGIFETELPVMDDADRRLYAMLTEYNENIAEPIVPAPNANTQNNGNAVNAVNAANNALNAHNINNANAANQINIGIIQPVNEAPPLGLKKTSDVQFEEEYCLNMVDWDRIDRETEEERAALLAHNV